jgi:hypothetical protein
MDDVPDINDLQNHLEVAASHAASLTQRLVQAFEQWAQDFPQLARALPIDLGVKDFVAQVIPPVILAHVEGSLQASRNLEPSQRPDPDVETEEAIAIFVHDLTDLLRQALGLNAETLRAYQQRERRFTGLTSERN